MTRKHILFLFSLIVFSVNAIAGDVSHVETDYSEIEAAERQYIINELTYRLDTKNNCNQIQKWTDKDSGADLDGYFFIPSVKDKFFMIGGFGTQSRKTSLCVITVSEPQNNPENTPTLLVAPIDWKLIWNDKGSGARKDGSMWEAIPPDSNYKCLGSIPQKGYKKPVLSNYRCVHVSLTKKIISNSVVWSDKGSNADKKVTMFRLPNINSFTAVKGRLNKIETFDLKAGAAVKPDPKLVEEKLAMRMEKIQQDLEAGLKTEIEQKQLAEDAKQKQLAEEAKQKQLAEEAKQKPLAEEADQKRLAEEAEQKRLAEEAEQKRLAEETKQKQLAEGAEQKRLAEKEEQKQLAEEAKQKQLAEVPNKTEVAVTNNENIITDVNNKKSSGITGLIIYFLKVFLIVIGLFIFLGIIIFKSIKGSRSKAAG